jgi:OmcA/MtrC family decaheme c-type cytochrome
MISNSVSKSRIVMLGLLLLSLVFVFAGCAGDEGSAGLPGQAGPAGQDGQDVSAVAKLETCIVCHGNNRAADPAALHPGLQTPLAVTTVISAVTTSTTGTATQLVTAFTVTGPGVLSSLTGTTTQDAGNRLAFLRLGYAKLVPAANPGDPDIWVTYTSGDRLFTRLTATAISSGFSFTYVSAVFNNATTFNLAATTRVMLLISGSAVADAQNATFDLVPDGSAITLTRDITTTAACNECHNKLIGPLSVSVLEDGSPVHDGARFVTKVCVVCHTTTLGGGVAEFAPMVHKIHAAKKDFGLGDFSEVTLPQALFNCRKCHKGTDGDHWMTRPSMQACATCHDIVFFDTQITPAPAGFTPHSGGPQTSNAACTFCHPNDLTPISTNHAPIPTAHQADDSTPHNPFPPTGAASFAYEISSVTTDSNLPVVTFRILTGATFTTTTTPVTLSCTASSNTNTAGTLLTGFSGSPSFLVVYALPQDGVTTMTDWNNLGKPSGQPVSVAIANVCNGTQGSMTGPDASGFYTATLRGSNNSAAFPAGATLRAVALQGYFTQISPALPRHAVSVQRGVTGDAVRRNVVDPEKCALCHEFFQGHGGNRVKETQVCVMCHVPNLSSSGRGANVANLTAANAAALTAAGFDATNPATWPEKSMNFKDLIHGIHASGKRVKPFEWVRDRGTSGVFFYDMAEVTFPGVLSDCETCHRPGTFNIDVMPSSVLPSTDVTSDGTGTTTVAQDRASLPNATDLVISPVTAACIACHDTGVAAIHTQQNGGSTGVPRQ